MHAVTILHYPEIFWFSQCGLVFLIPAAESLNLISMSKDSCGTTVSQSIWNSISSSWESDSCLEKRVVLIRSRSKLLVQFIYQLWFCFMQFQFGYTWHVNYQVMHKRSSVFPFKLNCRMTQLLVLLPAIISYHPCPLWRQILTHNSHAQRELIR